MEWQYLQRTVPGVGTLMGRIEEALREKFFPSLFRGEEITAYFWKILGHIINPIEWPSTLHDALPIFVGM